MLRHEQRGQPFHGEFSSADASALSEANSRLSLYPPGSTSAITLASTDQVLITDIKVGVGATALTVTVYDGADATAGAGEVIDKGGYAVNTSQSQNRVIGHYCQAGTYPKVKTSAAGQVDVILTGIILKAG